MKYNKFKNVQVWSPLDFKYEFTVFGVIEYTEYYL